MVRHYSAQIGNECTKVVRSNHFKESTNIQNKIIAKMFNSNTVVLKFKTYYILYKKKCWLIIS